MNWLDLILCIHVEYKLYLYFYIFSPLLSDY